MCLTTNCNQIDASLGRCIWSYFEGAGVVVEMFCLESVCQSHNVTPPPRFKHIFSRVTRVLHGRMFKDDFVGASD